MSNNPEQRWKPNLASHFEDSCCEEVRGWSCAVVAASVEARGGDGVRLPAVKLRVLVADDEEVIADTLALILNRSGFEARASYDGQEAVGACRSFSPDVLLSDVTMPEMTGIDAAIAVLAERPTCRILLFSGQAATVDLLAKARALGHAFEVLQKPVHPAALLEKLREGEAR